jgi:hypothetical protein
MISSQLSSISGAGATMTTDGTGRDGIVESVLPDMSKG